MENFFISEKPVFFRAKNATVSTMRSGTDYCWLYCDFSTLIVIAKNNEKFSNWSKNRKKSGFVVSGLVDGSGGSKISPENVKCQL